MENSSCSPSTIVSAPSRSAETSLGWDQVVRAGWRPRYLWFEIAGGSRAIIPLRAIDDRDSLEQLFRDQGKLSS